MATFEAYFEMRNLRLPPWQPVDSSKISIIGHFLASSLKNLLQR